MIAAGAPIAALMEEPRWVGFRLEPRKAGGKPTKVPYEPGSGRPAKTNDPRTWGRFEQAEAMAGCDGVGFVLHGLAELAAIDLDHCRDKATGRIEPEAEDLCERAQSYTEITPSGEGLRILGIATGVPPTINTLPRGKGQVEIFAGGCAKYVTVSFQRLDEYPPELNDISGVVRELLEEVEAGKPKESPSQAQPGSNADELLRLLPNDYGRDRWVALGLAHKAAGGGFEGFDRWSAQHSSYNERETRRVWGSLKPNGGIGPGSLRHELRAHGIEPPAPRGESDATLPFIDVAALEGRPVPPRQWVIPELLPAANVGVLSGHGATGKTTLLLQLAAGHALARGWLNHMPEPGRVLLVLCEDEADEIHRRLACIADHHAARLADMGDLVPLSLAGRNAVLAVPNKGGILQPTPLFHQIRQKALALRPKLIGIDNLADVYSGDENARGLARQFLTLLRSLALETGAHVLMTLHPSLTGMSTGTGMSGNTAWFNSVRAQMYLKPATMESGEEPDKDLRQLETRKNNYGRLAATTLLRWRDGIFVVEGAVGGLEKLAADARTEDVFLALLQRFTVENRSVSPNPGRTHAPSLFASEPEAKGLGSKDLATAMSRLFEANKIHVRRYGPPSRERSQLVPGGRP